MVIVRGVFVSKQCLHARHGASCVCCVDEVWWTLTVGDSEKHKLELRAVLLQRNLEGSKGQIQAFRYLLPSAYSRCPSQ